MSGELPEDPKLKAVSASPVLKTAVVPASPGPSIEIKSKEETEESSEVTVRANTNEVKPPPVLMSLPTNTQDNIGTIIKEFTEATIGVVHNLTKKLITRNPEIKLKDSVEDCSKATQDDKPKRNKL
jgi:hypothetical protein